MKDKFVRLWSLHPRYLDAKGLVALWREALLAQKVLRGKTRGYRFHPQLSRFRQHPSPVAAIAAYLNAVADEAHRRGYHFDRRRIARARRASKISVTDGQLRYELRHLRAKLRVRDAQRLKLLPSLAEINAHPLFKTITGPVAPWERYKTI